MSVVILLFSLFHLAASRFAVSEPVLKIIFGNIGLLRDLALPAPQTRRNNEETDVYGDHEALPEFHDFYDALDEIKVLDIKKYKEFDFDVKELNNATKRMDDLKKNLDMVTKDHHIETRRVNEYGLNLPTEVPSLLTSPVRLREWYYMKLTLTLLIHIRFQVDAAVRYRMATVLKGYKIGYLFHRMSKIKYQMNRILEEWATLQTRMPLQNRPTWRTKKHSLKWMLQLYEKMQELDVDMKDTMEMVKMSFFGRPMFVTQQFTTTSKPFFK